MSPDHNPLTPLYDALLPYDANDLLTVAGALRLLPDNASRAISIDALAHVIASLPSGEAKPAITVNRLRQLVKAHLG